MAQTCPGGKIVTPWQFPRHSSALLRLTVRADGTAEGHIDADAGRWLITVTPEGQQVTLVKP